jgi:hypothetical protein
MPKTIIVSEEWKAFGTQATPIEARVDNLHSAGEKDQRWKEAGKMVFDPNHFKTLRFIREL